jgi:hypothetical protein
MEENDYYTLLKYFLIKLAYYYCLNTDILIQEKMNSFDVDIKNVIWANFVNSQFYGKLKDYSE